MEFTRGAPPILLPEDKIDLIVEGFAKTFTPRRAAGWAGVSDYHLRKWMKEGQQDVINGISSSLNAQLFEKVSKVLSQRAAEYIEYLRHCPKNYGALTWLLEKCLKQDYGTDSDEYKELVDLYKKLLESYNALANKNPIGGIENGGEMDSESNQEAGGIA